MTSAERFMLAPDRRAVREARLQVRAFDDLPRQTGADAELVVSELVANSVLHARMGPDDVIEVTLRREGEHLLIEVADGGGFSRRPGSKGGWGFRVLDAVCERWNADGGRVCAMIAIPPGSHGSGAANASSAARSLRHPLGRART